MLLRLRHAMEFWLSVVLGRNERTTVRGRLIRGSAGTLGVHVLFYLLIFTTSIVLARLLGAAGYGAYAYALSWAMLLTVPAGLGLRQVTLRSVASYEVSKQWGLIRSQVRWSDRVTLTSSIVTVSVAAFVLWWLGDRLESTARAALAVILLLPPLVALLRIRQAATVGLHRIVQGQLPENVLIHAVLLALTMLAYLTVPHALTADLVAALHVLAAAAALAVAALMLRRVLPVTIPQSWPDASLRSQWLRGGIYLTAVGLTTAINSRADVLVLGSFIGSDAAGIYNVAARGADLVGFGLMQLVPALSPVLSNLHSTGQHQRMQSVLTLTARLALVSAVPIAVAFWVLGDWYLMLFGPEFTDGRLALDILAFKQLAYAAMGPSAYVLMMTGQDKLTAAAFAIGATTNVCFNLLLVPPLGMEGAAIATTLGALSSASLMTLFVLRRLGLDATAAGLLHRLHGRSPQRFS